MIEGHKDSGAGKVDKGGEGLLDSRRKRLKKKKMVDTEMRLFRKK